MKIGDTYSIDRSFSTEDVLKFAELSGDDNPVHTDNAYASTTSFGAPIVHGMLTASLISQLLGKYLPGQGTIYLSQSLAFKAPVYMGMAIKATVEVTSINPKSRKCELSTRCTDDEGNILLEGQALVLLPNNQF